MRDPPHPSSAEARVDIQLGKDACSAVRDFWRILGAARVAPGDMRWPLGLACRSPWCRGAVGLRAPSSDHACWRETLTGRAGNGGEGADEEQTKGRARGERRGSMERRHVRSPFEDGPGGRGQRAASAAPRGHTSGACSCCFGARCICTGM